MAGRIKILRDRKAALVKEADGLLDIQATGKLTTDQEARYAAIEGELATVNASIAREERLMDERRTMQPAQHTDNEDTPEETRSRVQVPEPPKFASLGEELQAIAFASQKGVHREEWDRRLVPLFRPGGLNASMGAQEKVPSDGGFLVQQDLGAPIIDSMFAGGEILKRVRHRTISSNANGIVIPAIDETSRANGSRWGGVQVYWADEGETVPPSKPKFRNMDMRLHKLFGLAYATDELLADAPLLESIFKDAFTEEITFKVEDAIINGTGVGQPLGILTAAGMVSVAGTPAQPIGVSTINVLGMFNRLPTRSMMKAVWLVNPELLPYIQQLTIGVDGAAARLYTIPGDSGYASAGSGGNLLGRPIIPCEYCSAPGTPGDIILVDLDQYLLIDKGGMKQESSIHVRFIYDEMTFRFIYRVDGQPMQRSAITPYKGTATISPYLTLGARPVA